MSKKVAMSLALMAGLGLSACTSPYDPGQRAVGGGLLGAGAGAAIGSLAGGGRGAAIGALIGGGTGALGGAATTPNRPQTYYQEQPYQQQQYQQPAYQQAPQYYQPRQPYGY